MSKKKYSKKKPVYLGDFVAAQPDKSIILYLNIMLEMHLDLIDGKGPK